MDLNLPEGAVWIVILIALAIQFAKKFKVVVEKYNEFLPYLAVCMGMFGVAIDLTLVQKVAVSIPDVVIGGVAVGLIASGAYDALKPLGITLKNGVGKATAAILLCLALFIGGCSTGGYMSPEVRYGAEQQIIISKANVRDCRSGVMTQDECCDALEAQAEVLKAIVGNNAGVVIDGGK